ncbi:uridine kinase [Nakamurella sp.]|uniref:uridine kinase n=1 Tax=Nakamurella sp. TaxID=1869182 RepID=UPI003B3B9EEE
MRFRPLTPALLARDLADHIDRRPEPRPRVGIDGFAETGADGLADAVGERLRELGRPVIRASTRWWWRAASLRLELGRTDPDMLLYGWVDGGALRRELLDPVAAAAPGGYLPRLRDPATDRAIRDERRPVREGTIVLIDGPFLLADPDGLDAVVHLRLSPAALARALPADRQWWVPAYERYVADERPAARADATVTYDHPAAPAIAWRTESH